MKREDLLDLNFDWRDEKTFKKALKESNLSEKEKLGLRDERMRRLELEAIKKDSGDYDEYENSEEVTETDEDPAEEVSEEHSEPEAETKHKKSGKNKTKDGGLIVALKNEYPMRKGFIALLMCAFIVILPFITYYHAQPMTTFTTTYFSASSPKGTKVPYQTDWFLFQKEFCVIIAAVLILLLFIVEECFIEKQYKDIPLRKKNLRTPLILTGIYALLLIISGIASEHKEVVMMGMLKHYEGLLGVLGYLIIFLAGMNYFCDTKSMKRFGNAMMILAGLAGIFAVMEFLGKPIVETEIFAHLIAPKEKLQVARSLHSSSNNVHITFFNSNYFGSFCGLMFPVTAGVALGCKNIFKKLAGLLAAAGLAFGAIVSNSSGGLYSLAGGGALLVLFYIVYWCRGLINRKVSLIGIICVGALGVGGLTFMLKTNETFAAQFEKVVSNGVTSKETLEQKHQRLSASRFVLKDIRQNGSELEMEDYNGNVIIAAVQENDDGSLSPRFFDTDHEPLEYYGDENTYYFNDERYQNASFEFRAQNKLDIDLGYKKKLTFQYDRDDEKFKPFVHGLYTMDEINTYKGPEFFKDKLSFGTGRGFIWGTTLTMIDECIIIGKGNGNFVCNFPQYDYVSLLEVYSTPAMVVNKPHCWYLGIIVESGMISLLAVLGLLVIFVWRGFKTCILRPVNDRFMHMRLGIFISVIAYMVVGVVNDSYVCVSPVFWFIFGVGMYAVSGNEVIETE